MAHQKNNGLLIRTFAAHPSFSCCGTLVRVTRPTNMNLPGPPRAEKQSERRTPAS